LKVFMAARPVTTFSPTKKILEKECVRLASLAQRTAKLTLGENGRAAPKDVEPVRRSGDGFSTAHFMVDGTALISVVR
jgi:hypothetical protein